MTCDQKIGYTFLAALAVLAILVACLGIYGLYQDHACEGYYLRNGNIWASYPWAVDMRAFDYTPEMWESLVDGGLTLPPKK